MRQILSILFLLLVVGPPAPAKEANNYPFRRLEVADGLSNNSVNAIHKDLDGFIWLATAAGLNRFDGYNFRVFRTINQDSTSIPNNTVHQIVETNPGQFWILTDHGYILFDKRTERFIRDISPSMTQMGSRGEPAIIYADRQGNSWFHVVGEGIYRQKAGKEAFDLLPANTERLPQERIVDIKECDEGLLLFFEDGTLSCVDRESLAIRWINTRIKERRAKARNEILTIFVDHENCVWFSDIKNLWVYDLTNDQWRDEWMNLVKRPDIIHDIAQDTRGQIWLATDFNGILILDKKSGQVQNLRSDPNDERSLPHNTVYSLYADPDGLMWVGTYKKGAAYYSESAFKFRMNVLGDITCAVENGDDNRLWLGTNDQGLLLWDPTEDTQHHYDTGNSALQSNAIVALLKARDGRLWIGTFGGGLAYLDNGRIRPFPLRTAEDAPNANLNYIWALDEDSRGAIWIATLGGGLHRYDPATGEQTVFNQTNSQLTDNYIASIHIGNDQTLVIGTASQGICVMDLRTYRIQKMTDSLHTQSNSTKKHVNQVYRDSRGLIWIATREGLNIFDEKHKAFLDLSQIDPLPNEIIAGITEDTHGDMWVASTRKIFHIRMINDNKSRFYRPMLAHAYDTWDGLQNGDFNLRSMRSLKSGQIIIGGLYGVNMFDPNNIIYNKKAPRVMFSSVSLFGKELEIGKPYDGHVILDEEPNSLKCLNLSYRQNIFQIEFASDNFTLPEKTTYQYWLEGFSDTWLELMPGQHGVTFTNLSPGSYTLRVKAINSDGYTSDEETTLPIKIAPPFWMSGWAYAIYTLAILGALFLSHRQILRNERRKYEIQRIEQEAAKNEEINQMKFRFFTNISHELRTPLTLIITPLEGLLKEEHDGPKREKLNLIYRNAQRLLTLVNQLLDFRKSEMGSHQLALSESDLIAFVHNVCDSFLLWADKKSIQFSFFASTGQLFMAFDPDKISKIIMNLLSNAFKFTPEKGRIKVLVEPVNRQENEWVEIKVVDTGIGIPDSEKPHIFDLFYQIDPQGKIDSTGTGIGLSLVRDFTELHGGTVEVYDNPGQGTIFVVALPVKHIDKPVQSFDTPRKETLPDETGEHEETTADEDENKSKPLALIVDDNADFRTFMRISLELQFRVRLAANGKEAWEMMAQTLPDIVVSDVMMPEMDGNELCRLIKQDKRTQRVPVILLTARQSADQQKEGLTIADDYVTKPFHLELLILRMRKLIEWSHRRDNGNGTPERIDPAPKEIEITPLDEKLIERAIQYVEDNMSRGDLSVEELSKVLGMSRVNLYKRLLQITGKTPIEFIRVIRLKRAAQLLRESQMHISEIAFEVGFNNPKYFSRYFKEEFGMLPSVYQEQYGNKSQEALRSAINKAITSE